MVKETIIFVSTREARASAGRVRVQYFKQALKSNGYNIIDFEINLSGLKKYISYFLRRPPKRVIHASKNANLIITTSPTLLNAIISYRIARKNNLPLIVDIRDVWEEYAKAAHLLTYRLGIVKRIVMEYYEALYYASKIFVTTEPMKQYYEKTLDAKDKVVVISNGTDIDIIKCNEKIKRDDDLVYLADLDWPYHNLEFLLKTLKNNGLHLTVIGDGKYLPVMKEYAQTLGINKKVSFVGWIPYENLTDYLCKAKIGVVGRPFISNIGYLYAIPVKTYDYLAAGLPIAGYGPGKSALEEFVKRNAIGTYISQPDPKVMLYELTELVKEHDRYVKKTRELAINFDRKKLAQKVIDTVKSVLVKF
ncbi:MAG: glycosyltransferase [Candidatus Bathyarchaeia archaeon]